MRFEAVQGFANIRRDEVGPALAAGLFFFCVLTAQMVVRPAREALFTVVPLAAAWMALGVRRGCAQRRRASGTQPTEGGTA